MNASDRPLANHCCPRCGADNACQPARSGSFDTDCWCRQVTVDKAVLQALPESDRGIGCLCRRCATAERA